ncbi:hypothetical protein [Virgibacillus pantothenticus]|uniref:hypothetical protein n=1 Tax=Virgibacillus pantothenticus TaxID=1473 RepID=UPI0009852B4F|nr:hypothetical protein [Virgibacillus pantothenticus]
MNYIRQQVNGKRQTYAEVARRTNRDPRTVQKYANQNDFQPELKGKKHQPPLNLSCPFQLDTEYPSLLCAE